MYPSLYYQYAYEVHPHLTLFSGMPVVNQAMGLVTGGNKIASQAVLAIMSQVSW